MTGITLSEEERTMLLDAINEAENYRINYIPINTGWGDLLAKCIALLTRDQAHEVCECKDGPTCNPNPGIHSTQECYRCGKRIKETTK